MLSRVLVGWTAVAVLGLVAVSALPASAQSDRWMSHTSLREITALTSTGEAVWAATTGGVFRYADGELTAFTAREGLHSVQTRAIAYDGRRESVWIGYRDGVIDRLDVASGGVRAFLDVARAERFTDRSINRLVVHGDSLLVATAFGLVVFDPEKDEVRATYQQFGSLPQGTAVFDALVAPTPQGEDGLWVATAEGVAFAPLSAANLQDPGVWVVEDAGLPSTDVRAVGAFDGRVYAGTAAGLAVRGEDGTYEDLGLTARVVSDIAATQGRLAAVSRFLLLTVERSGAARSFNIAGYQDPTAVVPADGSRFWVGDREGGLLVVDVPPPPATEVAVVEEQVYPQGPFHNLFSDLVVSEDGSLWAAGVPASSEAPGTGFYRMDPQGRWTDFVSARVPELGGRSSFERIHVDEQGSAWAGSAGSGLVEVRPDGEVVVYDERNSSLQSAKGTSNFILVGGIASEDDGTLWVTNRAAPAPLHVRSPDGSWTGFDNFSCGNFRAIGMTFDHILIDDYGQKWIVVRDEANLRRTLGVLVLDTQGTPTDNDDDVCRFFDEEGNSGQHLPSTDGIEALAEGRDGLMWIGTDEGPAYVLNSGLVARDPTAVPVWPQYADRDEGTWLLSGVAINDLTVDPANRVWFATDVGAWLVAEASGGYEVVEAFTAQNSPLFSSTIQSIAVEPREGRVYMATDRGLLSYAGDAVSPVEQVDDLLVYPNPVRMAEGEAASIFIEGLVEATELRVLAPHGALVARLETRGGRARWDGRDVNGRLVSSGVYLVVAVGRNGEGAAYGKVAVIR